MRLSTLQTQPTTERSPQAQLVRRCNRLLLLIALCILVVLGFKCWRVYDRVQIVRADLSTLKAFVGAKRGQAMVAALGAELAKTRSDTVALRAEAGLFLPITPYLGWVPVYGNDIAAAAPLLDAAVDLSAAADDAFVVFGPLLSEQAATPISGARLREQIVANQAKLKSASVAIDHALAVWPGISVDTLSSSLRNQLLPVGQALPLVQLGLAFAPLLPDTIEDIQQLELYTTAQPNDLALAALGPLLAKTRTDVTALRSAAAPLLATLSSSTAMSSNPDLAAVGPLLAAAADMIAAADDSYQVLAPILLQRGGKQPLGEELAAQLASAQPQIIGAYQAAERASANWNRISLDTISPAIRVRLLPIGGLLATLHDGLELAQVLPRLLGADTPVEYLLLAQNPDELRATGGFIGANGVLTLDRGRFSGIVMDHSPRVDDVANLVYPNPPQPMLDYMNIEMWLFRDANWSPDFPTSASMARKLYRLDGRHDIANVVAFDPYALQTILAAIGPVTVEAAPQPISAENVVDYLRSENDADQGTADSKAYVGRLANAVFRRMQDRSANLDLWALAFAFRRVLNERHMLLSIQDPAIAPIFARYGWDGAVRPGSADFLMVVDTNMGYNKVNPSINEVISYTVDLRDPVAPVAELAVHYTHMAPAQGLCKQFGDVPENYAAMMRRCYYDYLRVLVPGGAALLGSMTQPVPDTWMDSGQGDDGAVQIGAGAAGTSELNTFLVVPAGAAHIVTFSYRLPATVLAKDTQGWHYRLAVQKQAGTRTTPFTLMLRLPAGARIVSTSPQMAIQDGEFTRLILSLDQDQAIDVVFEQQ